MTAMENVAGWKGSSLVDADGNKVGDIDEIYVDDDTGEPEWLTVNTGLFGTKSTFVPLAEARQEGDAVRVPYQKGQIKDAPRVGAGQHLSQDDEQELYSYYGLSYGDSGLPESGYASGVSGGTYEGGVAGGTYASDDPYASGAPEPTYETQDYDTRDYDTGTETREGTVGRDVSGPTTDDAMTRSEEELEVGTRRREAGKARLRKYVVTENVQTTVPVQREEVRVEREPITDANVDDAMGGPAISEEEHEVTLHEEELVADKRVVPKERVRLDTDTVTDEETVSEEVRREQIEADDDVNRRR